MRGLFGREMQSEQRVYLPFLEKVIEFECRQKKCQWFQFQVGSLSCARQVICVVHAHTPRRETCCEGKIWLEFTQDGKLLL